MSGDNTEAEQYQEELSEKVDDGGGCAEMWEALTAERESGGSVKRRSFLATIGVASLLPTGVTAAKDETTETVELEGAEAKKVLSEMRSSGEGKTLIHYLKEKGYSAKYEEATITRIDPAGAEEYETVILLFEVPDEDILDARLMWSSVRSSATGYEIRDGAEYELLVSEVEDGEGVTRTLTDSDLETPSTQTRVSTQQVSGCPPICPTIPQAWTCEGSVNWECVGKAISKSGIGCYPCYADPSRITCIPCIGNLLLNGYDFVDDCCNGSWEPIY